LAATVRKYEYDHAYAFKQNIEYSSILLSVSTIYFVVTCDYHFTARRNARIASAVLATAIPSVRPSVRLSVCHMPIWSHAVKTTARSTVQFALSDSKMCLVL